MNVNFRRYIINRIKFRSGLSIWAAGLQRPQILRKIKRNTVELGYNVIEGTK